ncbi:hypothetical protein H0H93_012184 [Arthromyces matolae]|nr:hypothetical protein H0H93_012184 [Arthromyces matolae]
MSDSTSSSDLQFQFPDVDRDVDPGSSQEEEGLSLTTYPPYCSNETLTRRERVMSQRQREGNELKEVFTVLGSTGNAPTGWAEIIANILTLLSSELETIFAQAPPSLDLLVDPRILRVYNITAGKVPDPAVAEARKRAFDAEELCPICYENMHTPSDSASEALSWEFCQQCGNATHKGCLEQWRASITRNGSNVLTCVWCRAIWGSRMAGSNHGARMWEGYINLASVTGISRDRDTSTYTRRRYFPDGHYDLVGYDDSSDDDATRIEEETQVLLEEGMATEEEIQMHMDDSEVTRIENEIMIRMEDEDEERSVEDGN